MNDDTTQKDDDLAKKIKEAEKEGEAQQKAEEENLNETEKLKEELTQMTEMAKRTMADFENYRRRQEDDRRKLIILANAELIRALLPILNNFDRAKEHVKDEGIEMCINQLHQVLQSAGLSPMEAVGKKFDPNLHEALVNGPGEKDVVIEELEKGYMLGDTILKHAKVKVGNGEQIEQDEIPPESKPKN